MARQGGGDGLHSGQRTEFMRMWRALREPQDIGQKGLRKVLGMDPHTHRRRGWRISRANHERSRITRQNIFSKGNGKSLKEFWTGDQIVSTLSLKTNSSMTVQRMGLGEETKAWLLTLPALWDHLGPTSWNSNVIGLGYVSSSRIVKFFKWF